jgi:hypothetical protein
MTKRLKAFQSGIGDNEDLFPKAPESSNIVEEFSYYLRLKGTKINNRATFPEAEFNAMLTLHANQKQANHPEESYNILLKGYPVFRVDYEVKAKARHNPATFKYKIGVKTGQWYRETGEKTGQTVKDGHFYKSSNSRVEDIITSDSNIPSDVFGGSYTVKSIAIMESGTNNTSIIIFSQDGENKIDSSDTNAIRDSYVYSKGSVYTGDIYEHKGSFTRSVTKRDGQIDLGTILNHSFPEPPAGQTVDYEIIDNSFHRNHINLRFSNGSSQTTNHNNNILLDTDYYMTKRITGDVKYGEPASIKIDSKNGWNRSIPNPSGLSRPDRFLIEKDDQSSSGYIKSNFGLSSSASITKFSTYNDDVDDRFTDTDYKIDDSLIIKSTHENYVDGAWVSNPRFFNGFVNGDGPLWMRKPYKATIEISRPKKVAEEDKEYYIIDYDIISLDYYNYRGSYKIPASIYPETIKVKLEIISYEYDYDGALDDDGVDIYFDDLTTERDLDNGIHENITVKSQTSIEENIEREWISPALSYDKINIRQGESYDRDLPDYGEFNIPDDVEPPFDYILDYDNQNINAEINNGVVSAYVRKSNNWPLNIHNGYYYLNQKENYLYANKKEVEVKDVGTDVEDRYEFKLSSTCERSFNVPESKVIEVDSKSDFENNKIASNIDLKTEEGIAKLAVNPSSNVKYSFADGMDIIDMAIDYERSQIIAGTGLSGLIIYDYYNKEKVAQLDHTNSPLKDRPISSVAYSNGRIAVGYEEDGVIVIGSENYSKLAEYTDESELNLYWRNGNKIRDLYLTDQYLIIGSGYGGGIAVIDFSTNMIEYYRTNGYEDYITSIDFDGEYIYASYSYSSGFNSGIIKWTFKDVDPDNTEEIYRDTSTYPIVVDIKAKDGKIYAAKRDDKKALIIDENGEIEEIASPDGTHLICVDVDSDYLYLGTMSGVYLYNFEHQVIEQEINNIVDFGLGNNANSIIKEKDKLFVGTVNGIAELGKKYESYGEMLSEIYDLSSDVADIDAITFDSIEEGGTRIVVTARTSDDMENWSNWELKPPKNRYYQFKVEMWSDDALDNRITPKLDKITIQYYKSEDRTEMVDIDTDPIKFIIRQDSRYHQLFNDTAEEILKEHIENKTDYSIDKLVIKDIRAEEISPNIEVEIQDNIIYAKTIFNQDDSNIDFILNEVPQQGSPIIVTDLETGNKLRAVKFQNEFGQYSIMKTETLEITKNSTVIASFTDIKDVVAYDLDGDLLDVSGVDENEVTVYKGRDSLPKGQKIELSYILRDSFIADQNFGEEQTRFTFSRKYENIKIEYEGSKFSKFYSAEEVELNPIFSPYVNGFSYISEDKKDPFYLKLEVSPEWTFFGVEENISVFCMITDILGNPIQNHGIELFTNTGSIEVENESKTDQYGVVRGILKPDDEARRITVTARVDGTTLTESKSVNVIEDKTPDYYLFVNSDTDLLATTDGDDLQETLVKARLVDEKWNPVYDEEIMFNIVSGRGSISGRKRTNNAGVATAVYTSGSNSGISTIKATAEINTKYYSDTKEIEVIDI